MSLLRKGALSILLLGPLAMLLETVAESAKPLLQSSTPLQLPLRLLRMPSLRLAEYSKRLSLQAVELAAAATNTRLRSLDCYSRRHRHQRLRALIMRTITVGQVFVFHLSFLPLLEQKAEKRG